MRIVGVIVVLILTLGAAGWWAWQMRRDRSWVLPPSGNAGYVPDSLQGDTASSTLRPTSGVVDVLPRGSGRTQGSRQRSRTRTGLASGLSAEGSIRWMRGARSVGFGTDSALRVTVTGSVEQGRFRVYLGDGEQYRWADATPGQPLELTGHLITGSTVYLFFAEAVDGRAEGIRWSVTS
ncbi:MAG: hypothetical protein Rubg2KO_33190 [Rubricoccaceae bacterium]